MIRSEIKDRNGKEIRAGDTLRFVNKREWYRCSHPFAPDVEIEKLPYEERQIKLPQDYSWLLLSEIKEYWEIVKRPIRKRGPKPGTPRKSKKRGKR